MAVFVKKSPDVETKIRCLGESADYDLCCPSFRHTTGRLPLYPAKTPRGVAVLLKVLYTNECLRNCAYCAFNAKSSIRRMSFSVKELVNATLSLYRRGLIKGLFLSSSIPDNPSAVMEKMILVAKELRLKYDFPGYIHLKILPGAAPELVKQAAVYADRVSVNAEFPTGDELKRLAPEKSLKQIFHYFQMINNLLQDEMRYLRAKSQTTQVIVGATGETDFQFLSFAHVAYSKYNMCRVYYSPFRRVTDDPRLPEKVPFTVYLRTRRLYQADSLIKVYGFTPQELLSSDIFNLPLDKDPKEWWAERHREFFPVDLHSASFEEIIRVPGIGPRTARKLLTARRFIHTWWEIERLIPRKARRFVLWKGKKLSASSVQFSLFKA